MHELVNPMRLHITKSLNIMMLNSIRNKLLAGSVTSPELHCTSGKQYKHFQSDGFRLSTLHFSLAVDIRTTHPVTPWGESTSESCEPAALRRSSSGRCTIGLGHARGYRDIGETRKLLLLRLESGELYPGALQVLYVRVRVLSPGVGRQRGPASRREAGARCPHCGRGSFSSCSSYRDYPQANLNLANSRGPGAAAGARPGGPGGPGGWRHRQTGMLLYLIIFISLRVYYTY